jgi:hypothetical protein
MNQTVIRTRDERISPNTGLWTSGEQWHYFTTTVFTFWDDDPFGTEFSADTIGELKRDLADERANCIRRAMHIDNGYLPVEQAFSHSRIERVNVTVG